MKKAYASPKFRMSMTVDPSLVKGRREEIKIGDTHMVVPNTYES